MPTCGRCWFDLVVFHCELHLSTRRSGLALDLGPRGLNDQRLVQPEASDVEFSTAGWKRLEVHLWPIQLVAGEESTAAYARLLSSSELGRVDRYLRKELRRAFILRTAAVRLLLGRYLEMPPGAIRFATGQNGKPHVVSSGGVSFSLSHSAALALVGIVHGCEIGVDVEHVRDLSDWEGLIRAICSPEEAHEMRLLPPDQQQRAFFECWTRKEAYLKARGWGLAREMASIRLKTENLGSRTRVRIEDLESDCAGWTLEDVPMMSTYCAAVAYGDSPRTVRVHPVVRAGDLIEAFC